MKYFNCQEFDQKKVHYKEKYLITFTAIIAKKQSVCHNN